MGKLLKRIVSHVSHHPDVTAPSENEDRLSQAEIVEMFASKHFQRPLDET
ncbi:MAG: hypothetical protein ABJL67_23245 [Sulfitobacter sp.]